MIFMACISDDRETGIPINPVILSYIPPIGRWGFPRIIYP
jgi:hypothetical protein